MPDFRHLLSKLESEKRELKASVVRIEKAIAALTPFPSRGSARRKFKMSAATRKKLSRAKKAYWRAKKKLTA